VTDVSALATTGENARAVIVWLDRLDDVLLRLRAHLEVEHPGRTQPDPGGTERWDVGQVWAHIAEFGDYWVAELRMELARQSDKPVSFGRVKTDPARIAAIEVGRDQDPHLHFATIERSAEELRSTLVAITDSDWERVGLHSTLGEMTIDRQLEEFHIGHYEEHASQLDSIT
jgi:hypothetical protein